MSTDRAPELPDGVTLTRSLNSDAITIHLTGLAIAEAGGLQSLLRRMLAVRLNPPPPTHAGHLIARANAALHRQRYLNAR